jgi:hypothetical protein
VARNEYKSSGTFSAERTTKPVKAPNWIFAFRVSGFALPWADAVTGSSVITAASIYRIAVELK